MRGRGRESRGSRVRVRFGVLLLVGTSVILTRVVDGRDRVVMAEGEDGPRRGSLAVMLRYG
jgi:hypothetical protein